ncbi:hypothetical protein V2E39_17110 [Chryseobacterium arthrosphaerae]|uniref:Uncharacterized protein n=1 Tax=Chryseobacterium arthrosphaerae TaxID=651561 RepID=A0ABU7R2U3_9FLAO
MSLDLDYKIAKDYLAKLPVDKRNELITGTLGQKVDKAEKTRIRKFCSDYIKNQIKSGKI